MGHRYGTGPESAAVKLLSEPMAIGVDGQVGPVPLVARLAAP
jgi:hypothetical protein